LADVVPGRVAGLARAVRVAVRAQRRARLALALADAAQLTAAVAEVRQLDLRQRDRDQLLAPAPDQLAPGEMPLEVLLDLAADDVLEPPAIALDTPDHTASTTAPAPSSTPAMVVMPAPARVTGRGRGGALAPARKAARSGPRPLRAAFPHVPPREDARDEVQHVRRAHVAVAVLVDEPALHDVDLLLRLLVQHAGDQARQLDRVLLVLEQLQLEGLLEPRVGVVAELLAIHRQRADVVHDLAAEVVLAALRDVDLLLDRPHQPLVRLLVLARVLVPDLLPLRVRLHVVDVVGAQPLERILAPGDRALDLVLHDVLVLLPHHRQQLP